LFFFIKSRRIHILYLLTILCKVSIFMANFALKGEFLIVQLLNMLPVIQRDKSDFNNPLFLIYFNVDSHTGKNVFFWLCMVNIFSNASQGIITPTMERKVWKVNPCWNSRWNIIFETEIQSPFVEVHPSQT